jgi:hypothetical protein
MPLPEITFHPRYLERAGARLNTLLSVRAFAGPHLYKVY